MKRWRDEMKRQRGEEIERPRDRKWRDREIKRQGDKETERYRD